MDAFFAVLWALPVPVQIAVGVIVAFLVLLGVGASTAERAAEGRKAAQRRATEAESRRARERAEAVKRQQQEEARQKKQQAEQRAAALRNAQRQREEQARLKDKQRLESLGKHGAALVERAESSVRTIVSSEAARAGWLGEVDFTPDLNDIEANLVKARTVRKKSDDLNALPKRDDADRTIIAGAKTTIAQLERRTKERVELLEKCASEARLIDESLKRERDEVKLARRREELHGELAAMLYGVEAAGATPAESAADVVMARVQAYREIKGAIERARDDAQAPTESRREKHDDSSGPWIVAPIRQVWKWVVD